MLTKTFFNTSKQPFSMESFTSDHFMDLFRAGDPGAFDSIYNALYDQLCYFTKGLTRNDGEGEDITAETFLKLWHKRGDFKTFANVKAFLFITARNAAFNFLRNAKVRMARNKKLAYSIDEFEDDELRAAIRSELVSHLFEELDKLPEKQRKVLIMSYLHDKSTAQISDELGISEDTVRSHKKNGLDKLRKADFLNKVINTILIILLIAAALGKFF